VFSALGTEPGKIVGKFDPRDPDKGQKMAKASMTFDSSQVKLIRSEEKLFRAALERHARPDRH
jgi:hypothetical protein